MMSLYLRILNMKERIWIEDALKHLHEREYRGEQGSEDSLSGALSIRREQALDLATRLESSGLVEIGTGGFRLTETGRDYARHVIRAHRLYETYLAHKIGVSAHRLHGLAEKKEHVLSGQEVHEMARTLGHPRFDPHGDPIPTEAGELPPLTGLPLLELDAGWEGRIEHVEDEPESVFAELSDSGVAPGMKIRILESDSFHVRLNIEGRTMNLSRAGASLVRVRPLEAGEHFDDDITRLSSLRKGEEATILGLSPACRGPERSRLLDLGIVPGSHVRIELVSPFGDPVAYLVRGATIALRREQAERIYIKKVQTRKVA